MADTPCEENNWLLTNEQLNAIRQAFDQFDTDKSGYLEVSELGALSSQLGEELEGDELEEAMRALDSSGDSKVDFAEFIAWWQEDDE
jgi:Ca2+-binding EF-hand superfamily protein